MYTFVLKHENTLLWEHTEIATVLDINNVVLMSFLPFEYAFFCCYLALEIRLTEINAEKFKHLTHWFVYLYSILLNVFEFKAFCHCPLLHCGKSQNSQSLMFAEMLLGVSVLFLCAIPNKSNCTVL